MASGDDTRTKLESDISQLRKQLTVARNEINNLRQQVKSLGYSHQKEMQRIRNMVESWKCAACSNKSPSPDDTISMCPVGIISTWFPKKKGIPRQPGLCGGAQGKLTIFSSVFPNPEHALEGLEGFSHMWILYYFHKNASSHVHAKVAPPRLNGARKGVFGTRSPHRPSPIGLSLVTIIRVKGASVYFSGVDMVDGTPVLDIKPYIPQYDSPLHHEYLPEREADDDSSLPEAQIGEREAPDGKEDTQSSVNLPSTSGSDSSSQIRIPNWIQQGSKFKVTFSDSARTQLKEFESDTDNLEDPERSIVSVLQEDPRSVYLRERWSGQRYTFTIRNLQVSCTFDDASCTATVIQVSRKQCDFQEPECQC